jgi:hypothetical protein
LPLLHVLLLMDWAICQWYHTIQTDNYIYCQWRG